MTSDHTPRFSRRTAIAGAAGAAATLAGAQSIGAAPSRTTGPAQTSSQDAITLKATVWLGDAEFKAMESLGAKFTETNPNVTIEFINIVDGGPWGRDKLQQMIAGGDAPDLMMLNTGQFEAFAARGALAEIDERIAADAFDTTVYFTPAIEGCKLDGKTYGLPKDISDHVVYLNVDAFEAAGAELPANEWTWDEFREVAKSLTNTDNQKWGISLNNAAWSWGGFVHSNGGMILNDERTECLLGSEEAIAALNVYYGYLTTDGASVPPGSLPQTPGSGDQFLSGITAMHMAGPWFRPGLVENKPFNWTIRLFPRPSAESGLPTSVLYVDQWAMSATSEHAEEAWALLKFLGGPDGHNAWAELYGSRSITPISALAQSDAWLGYGGAEHLADNQTILDQLENTVAPPTNFGDGAEVENIWNEQFDLVMIGQQPMDVAVQTVVESVNGVLQGP